MRFERMDGQYALGLDLGVGSVGWAVLRLDGDKPVELCAAGSRIFPAGVNDIDQGRGTPLGQERRLARGRRKLLRRRAARRRALFRKLVELKLLPVPELGTQDATPESRLAVLTEVYDQAVSWLCIRLSISTELASAKATYLLRKLALTEVLPEYLLGFALYSLTARRGFKSNAKERQDAKTTGTPKKAGKRKASDAAEADSTEEVSAEVQEKVGLIRQIEVLNTRIAESGTGSVGAFLSTFDPHEVRIRGQKLDREAILAEFNKICAAQRAIVDIKAANALRVIAFKQLPLKSSAKLVGHCSFEPKARRAAIAMPSAQYFRLLQRVLDLEITPYQEARRKLGSVEQRDLLARLEQVPSLSMAKAKEVIGHNKVAKFSFDEDSASKLIGNRTNCALGPIFGDQWRKWTLAERDNVVRELLAIKSERGRVRHGRRRYGLSDEKAALLADLVLEDGYLGISLKAIAKVLPAMEQGERFGDVVTREYPPARVSPLQQLPTVKHFKPGLRNPVVIRTLTEMRRVVNALVKTFGKPARIRVELARDVQNGGEARLRIQKQQRDREQQRARALKQIEQLCPGREHPERWVEKLLLQQECGGRCPYTDQPITPAMALALDSPVEIEHIIPFSRSLDNSFGNKTLCFTDENRRKGNRAPSEHYDEQRLNEILGRIDKWRGPWRAIAAKRRRFAATPAEVADMLDSFAQRQLNDTRHAAKEARDFLALLYGGYADGEGKQRVFAGSGTLTALLRAAWQLRQTMPEVKNKRDDHRHHAVDAICIGLASQSMVKALADASARKYARGKTRAFSFDEMPLPWPEFVADAGRVVGELLVSHRVNTSLSGRLHEETHYGGPEGEARVTKLIESVAATELEHILDPSARLAIVAALNGAEPKVKFKSPEMRAAVVLATKSGRYIQIKRVRLRGKRSTIRIGTGLSTRQVALGSNSHAEVFKHKDGKFDWRVVSRLEAYRRVKRLGLPRVDKSVPLGGQFVTSLLPNEAVLLAGELYRVTVLSEGEFACIHSREARPVTDVRKEKTITTTKAYMRVTSGIAMAKYGFRRVRLDSLGRLIDDE